MTATVGANATVRAAWTAHTVGSTITACSSGMAAGTARTWLSWAISAIDQPPPGVGAVPGEESECPD